jgi:hypothetical protein
MLEYANVEVKAAHIRHIGTCSLEVISVEGLGPRSTRGAAIVDSSIVVSILSLMSLFYEIRLSGRLNGWRRWCGRMDNNFIVIICIMKLMHDFNNDADEIALARRQSSQQIKAACDES